MQIFIIIDDGHHVVFARSYSTRDIEWVVVESVLVDYPVFERCGIDLAASRSTTVSADSDTAFLMFDFLRAIPMIKNATYRDLLCSFM
jgi:hypothetical protein